MIIDQNDEFADAASIAGAAGTYLIGDVVDTSSASYGEAQNVAISLTLDEAPVGGSDSTIQIILASDAQAAVATDGTASRHYAVGPIPIASLVRGAKLSALVSNDGSMERFLGVLVIVAGTTLTAGAISAQLVLNAPDWKPTRSQFT